jgi:hypothetical protein
MNMETTDELTTQKQYFVERKNSLIDDLKKVRAEIAEKQTIAGEKILDGGDELAKRVLEEIAMLQTRETLLLEALKLADQNISGLSQKLDIVQNQKAETDLQKLKVGQEAIIQEIVNNALDLDERIKVFLQKSDEINAQVRALYPKVVVYPSTHEIVIAQLHHSLSSAFKRMEIVSPELLGIIRLSPDEIRLREAEKNVERAKERLDFYKDVYQVRKSAENDGNLEIATMDLARAKKVLSNLKRSGE